MSTDTYNISTITKVDVLNDPMFYTRVHYGTVEAHSGDSVNIMAEGVFSVNDGHLRQC